MKNTLFKSLLVFITMFVPFMAYAQSYEVYMKNGEKIVYDYNQVDSILFKAPASVDSPFNIVINELNQCSFKATITPKDESIEYIAMVADASYVKELGTPDAIFEDDMLMFKQYADMYGVSIQEMIEASKNVGVKELANNMLYPQTDYIIYVYGIDIANQERTTDMIFKEFTTTSVDYIDAKFNIESHVQGVYIESTYRPENYDGYYYANIMEGVPEDATEEEINTAFQNAFMNNVNMYKNFGMTNEQILDALCFKGEKNIPYPSVNATTTYLNAVAAVNADALICSNATHEFITTPAVEPSDNIVEISISEVGSYSAKASFKTKNKDPYTVIQLGADSWESQIEGKTDEEIKDILAYNASSIISGDYEEVLDGLHPDTRYLLIAFGFEGGTVTTDLFSAEFTTQEAKVCDAKISMMTDGYYSADEVAELDNTYKEKLGDMIGSGAYLFPFKFTVEPSEGMKIWYGFWNASFIEDQFVSDEEIISMITEGDPCTNFDNYEISTAYPGDRIVFTAVAEDANGARTLLWKGDVLDFNGENVGDAKYFVENYPYPYSTPAALNSCKMNPSKEGNRISVKNIDMNVKTQKKETVVSKPNFKSFASNKTAALQNNFSNKNILK